MIRRHLQSGEHQQLRKIKGKIHQSRNRDNHSHYIIRHIITPLSFKIIHTNFVFIVATFILGAIQLKAGFPHGTRHKGHLPHMLCQQDPIVYVDQQYINCQDRIMEISDFPVALVETTSATDMASH